MPDGRWRTDDRASDAVDGAVLAGPDLDARDRAQVAALADGLAVDDLERRFLHVPAGTVVIAHYDLFHRGSRAMANASARYLYKFYAARVRDPARSVPAPALSESTEIPDRVAPVVGRVARWLNPSESARTPRIESAAGTRPGVAELEDRLAWGREDERVSAAYLLAAKADDGSESALAALGAALKADREGVRRAAGHGHRYAGPEAAPILLVALDSDRASTRRVAVAALGSMEPAAADVVERLCNAVATDPEDLVRSNAAYSLGQIARSLPSTAETETAPLVDSVTDALLGRLGPGAEPDNAHNAGFSRSTVRQSAAFALLLVLTNHRLAEAQLATLVAGPLRDEDRYVQGLVVEGLIRADDLPRAINSQLVAHLATRRYSPVAVENA